jgi:hypothetical protein
MMPISQRIGNNRYLLSLVHRLRYQLPIGNVL